MSGTADDGRLAPHGGTLVDRFGIPWAINCEAPLQS